VAVDLVPYGSLAGDAGATTAVVAAAAAAADGLVRTMVVTKALAAMINTTTMPRQM
jgi:hypothetical protein